MTKPERKRLGRCRWTVTHGCRGNLRIHRTKRAALRDARRRASEGGRIIFLDRFSVESRKSWALMADGWSPVDAYYAGAVHMRRELDHLAIIGGSRW